MGRNESNLTTSESFNLSSGRRRHCLVVVSRTSSREQIPAVVPRIIKTAINKGKKKKRLNITDQLLFVNDDKKDGEAGFQAKQVDTNKQRDTPTTASESTCTTHRSLTDSSAGTGVEGNSKGSLFRTSEYDTERDENPSDEVDVNNADDDSDDDENDDECTSTASSSSSSSVNSISSNTTNVILGRVQNRLSVQANVDEIVKLREAIENQSVKSRAHISTKTELVERIQSRLSMQQYLGELAKLKAVIDQKDAELECRTGQLRRAIASKCDLAVACEKHERLLRKEKDAIIEEQARRERRLREKMDKLIGEVNFLKAKREGEREEWIKNFKQEMRDKDLQVAKLTETLSKLLKLNNEINRVKHKHREELEKREKVHRREMLKMDHQAAKITEELRGFVGNIKLGTWSKRKALFALSS